MPEELEKDNFGVLVLSCGPNEITNIDTTLNYKENIEHWRYKVAQSSVKMVQLAEWCLRSYPNLRSVIIVKRPPRYDDNIKAHLSEYANGILDDLLKERKNMRIVVSRQKLTCDGSLKIQRYGNPSFQNYDGIHLRGKLCKINDIQ